MTDRDRLSLLLLDVALNEGDSRRWAMIPGKPVLTNERQFVLDPKTGKLLYRSVVAFEARVIETAFSVAAVRAIRAAFPHALDPPTEAERAAPEPHPIPTEGSAPCR